MIGVRQLPPKSSFNSTEQNSVKMRFQISLEINKISNIFCLHRIHLESCESCADTNSD